MPADDLLLEVFSSKGRVRVLKTLVKHGNLNLNKICKLTGLHHKIVKSHIDEMVAAGVVLEETLGKVKMYKLNYSNPKIRKLARMIEVLEG